MAAELERETGYTAELIKGGNGIFDVKADDELIFSKYQVGRFPLRGEVTQLLEKHIK